MGLTPASAAKAASLRIRSGFGGRDEDLGGADGADTGLVE